MILIYVFEAGIILAAIGFVLHVIDRIRLGYWPDLPELREYQDDFFRPEDY